MVGGEMIRRMAAPFRGTVEIDDGTVWDERDYLAVAGGTIITTALLWVTSSWEPARGILLTYAALALLAVFAMRLIFGLMRGAGFLASRCLVIGTTDDARRAIDLIHRHPNAGLEVVGVVHCGKEPGIVGTLIAGCPVLGTGDTLRRLAQLHRINTLIVAAPGNVDATLLSRLRSFRYHGFALADYVTLHEELAHQIPVSDINEEWLFAASMHTSRPHVLRFKRVFDVVGSVGALVLTAPAIAVTAVLVALDSPGPVFHRQRRLGRTGVAFTILDCRPGGHAPVGRGDGTDRGSQYGGRRTSGGPRPRSPARVYAVSWKLHPAQILCETGVDNADVHFHSSDEPRPASASARVRGLLRAPLPRRSSATREWRTRTTIFVAARGALEVFIWPYGSGGEYNSLLGS
jgi:hypothetical protein